MIEIPESTTLAAQVDAQLAGRTVTGVQVAARPNPFVHFTGDPAAYPSVLTGRTVTGGTGMASFLRIALADGDDVVELTVNDGARPTLLTLDQAAKPVAKSHQLRLDLDDGSALVFTVQMYGAIRLLGGLDEDGRTRPVPGVDDGGEEESFYDRAARTSPSPLADGFDAHWQGLLAAEGADRLSLKAVLATHQRIPGLGNGVLQDILWTARMSPRRKLGTLDAAERDLLRDSVTGVLRTMVADGGRDTEKMLDGRPGGYQTVMCLAALDRGCPRCGGAVEKAAYLGGRVYVCPVCQPAP